MAAFVAIGISVLGSLAWFGILLEAEFGKGDQDE